MEILIFSNKDLKTTGQFKKKNNAFKMNEEQFKKYVKDNGLIVSSGYIDSVGYVKNASVDLKFKCFYNGIIIGTSGIVKEINNIKEGVEE